VLCVAVAAAGLLPAAFSNNADPSTSSRTLPPCHHLHHPKPSVTLQVTAAPRAAARRSVRALAVRAEISYVMVKPDGVQRGLVGDIISRFERKGFKLVGLKLYQTPKEVAEEHYKELSSKPFYGKLVEYIVSGPVVAMVSWHR
jgi:nucleoside-diphosphate kinase